MSFITPELLSSIQSQPHLPPNTWYYVVITTLSILNRPKEIPKVYQHALDQIPQDLDSQSAFNARLNISRRTREALVKASSIGGFPKVYRSYPELYVPTN